MTEIRYVLASGSPRRKELIKQVVDNVEIITADVDERSIEEKLLSNFKGAPCQDAAGWISMELAFAKAKAVFEKLGSPENTVVIGADTSVALPDEILGKPIDREDAVRMLRKESLEPQYVLTGVAFVGLGKERKFVKSSKVVFKGLDEIQEKRIQEYCDTKDPYDKAGAYGIQAYAAKLVDYYDGNIDNIIGLPVGKVKEELDIFIGNTEKETKMNNRTDKWIEAHKDEMIKDLSELIKFRSLEADPIDGKPFGKNVDDCLQTALEYGRKFGFKATDLDGYCGLLDVGEGDETFGILAHLDVVPEGDGWTYPPYGAEIHDGKLFGRGTIDDKGPAVAAMYALAAVKNCGFNFNRKVRIILGCNEETNMKCVEHYLEKEKAPDLTITPDGTFPLSYCEKSILHMTYRKEFQSNVVMNVGEAPNIVPGYAEAVVNGKKYTCTGVQAHASLPEDGKNAIQMMFLKLNELGLDGEDGKLLKVLCDNLKMEYYGETLGIDRTDDAGRQTVNVGMVRWDEKGFEITFDLRCPSSVPEKDIYGPFDEMFEQLDAKRVYYKYSPGYSIPVDCELVSKLMKVYQDRTGDKESQPQKMGGGTYARHLPNAVSFGPEGWLCEANCHVANEFISLEQLEFLTKIIADAIIALACE